jgi:hypothetical protein
MDTITNPLKRGITKLAVFKRGEDKKVTKIHEGVVVQDLGTHARLFNPHKDGGDTSPEYAEVFPLNGRSVWCEFVNELAVALPIPACLK